jgi:hypothetical protein
MLFSGSSSGQIHAPAHLLILMVKVLVIDVCSATIAMYCLDQFTFQLKDQLVSHKPTFKLVCIKLVFAFSLYQTVCSVSIGLLITSNR